MTDELRKARISRGEILPRRKEKLVKKTMKKTNPVAPHEETFRPLETSELRSAIGRGRLRPPGGDPLVDDPVDDDGNG